MQMHNFFSFFFLSQVKLYLTQNSSKISTKQSLVHIRQVDRLDNETKTATATKKNSQRIGKKKFKVKEKSTVFFSHCWCPLFQFNVLIYIHVSHLMEKFWNAGDDRNNLTWLVLRQNSKFLIWIYIYGGVRCILCISNGLFFLCGFLQQWSTVMTTFPLIVPTESIQLNCILCALCNGNNALYSSFYSL